MTLKAHNYKNPRRQIKLRTLICDVCNSEYIAIYKKSPAVCGECYVKSSGKSGWQWLKDELAKKGLKLKNGNFKPKL